MVNTVNLRRLSRFLLSDNLGEELLPDPGRFTGVDNFANEVITDNICVLQRLPGPKQHGYHDQRQEAGGYQANHLNRGRNDRVAATLSCQILAVFVKLILSTANLRDFRLNVGVEIDQRFARFGVMLDELARRGCGIRRHAQQFIDLLLT